MAPTDATGDPPWPPFPIPDEGAGSGTHIAGVDPTVALARQLRAVVAGRQARSIVETPSVLSARDAKEAVEPIDPLDVLAGVRELDVATWRYASEDDSVRHMGPMAAAFADEFGLGADGDRIAAVDADGVALGAIQGLARRLDDQRQLIATQRETIETQRAQLEAQREKLERCAARLDALEAKVARDSTTD